MGELFTIRGLVESMTRLTGGAQEVRITIYCDHQAVDFEAPWSVAKDIRLGEEIEIVARRPAARASGEGGK